MRAAVLAAVLFVGARHAGYAQDLCPGDVDGDGTITSADVTAAIPLLFDDDGTDPEAPTRTDANGDGSLSAGDITAILLLQGRPCVSASPTPTPTPTAEPTGPTRTATGTPTKTLSPTPTRTAATPTQTMTPRPSPTATPTCIMQPAHLGTTGGQLTANDCQQDISGAQRYADVYTIVGTPGTAIEITAASASLIPYLVLTDADGQFDSVEGAAPIEFVVTTPRPYQLVVSTAPSSPTQLGSYALTLQALACPAPLAITVNSLAHAGNITVAACPDPAFPTVGANASPVDQYTFSVSQVPTNISIAMRQLNSNDSIDPDLTLIGPDGFAVGSDDDSGGGVNGFDALMHFLALQAGTYTIIAGGGGGTGGYSLALTAPTCSTTALTNIPSDRPLTCPNQAGPGCQGTLYTTLPGGLPTTCNAAPLGVPGATTTTPDIDSPADVYTFKASAGDVISVGMNSDDVAHLYLLGPLTTGSAPLVAEDDSSGLFAGSGGAQLAATLPVAGTYTIVAANDNALQLTDPPVNYTLYVQKCPVQGLLSASTGQTISDTFNAFDCVGFFNLPYRTYAFDGIAGQFVTTTVSSTDIDAFVRVFAPNGRHVDDDDDLFNTSGSDARANWVLPQTGRYYVEVSVSPNQGTVNATSPLGFAVRAQSCPVSSVAPGTVNGQFLDSDCELASGQKFDVYTFTAGTPPRAATILPPSNACVVGLFAQEGLQTPTGACSTDLLEMPILGTGRYGFMIAADDAITRGAYAVQVSSCPLTTLGYGDTRAGTLVPTDCADAAGAPADWFWFQAATDVVQFNCGLSGTVTAGFPLAGVLTDAVGPDTVVGDFTDDAGSMFPIGSNLGVLLKVTGATSAATGSYTVSVDPASLR